MMTKGKQLENNRAHAALVKMDGWTDGWTDGRRNDPRNRLLYKYQAQSKESAIRSCCKTLPGYSLFFFLLLFDFSYYYYSFPFFFLFDFALKRPREKKGVQTRAYSRHLETVEGKKNAEENLNFETIQRLIKMGIKTKRTQPKTGGWEWGKILLLLLPPPQYIHIVTKHRHQ